MERASILVIYEAEVPAQNIEKSSVPTDWSVTDNRPLLGIPEDATNHFLVQPDRHHLPREEKGRSQHKGKSNEKYSFTDTWGVLEGSLVDDGRPVPTLTWQETI